MQLYYRLLVLSLVFIVSSHPKAKASEISPIHSFDPYIFKQRWPQQGPWFEGWYLRLHDRTNQRSFALIGTSSTKGKESLPEGPNEISGYQALFFDQGDEDAPLVFEDFPQKTVLRNKYLQSIDDQELQLPAQNNIRRLKKSLVDFEWSNELGSRWSKSEIQLNFTNGAALKLNLQDRAPWGEYGPMGILRRFSVLPLYWHVHSLRSLGQYSLRLPDGSVFSGSGEVHLEKNWGKVFPKSWIWGQGFSDNIEIAFAGGKVPTRLIPIEAYMVGVSIKGQFYEFRPTQLGYNFSRKISLATKTFSLFIKNSKYSLSLTSQAPENTFNYLSIPTLEGYRPKGAIESFRATLKGQIRNAEGLILHEFVLINSALEFGGFEILKPVNSP